MIILQGSMRSELSDLHSLVVPKHKLTRGIFAIFGSLQKVIAVMTWNGGDADDHETKWLIAVK